MRVKVQLDCGDIIEVSIAKVIIEGVGEDEDEQVHVTLTDEGMIVDHMVDDEIIATCNTDVEFLTSLTQ